MFMHLKKGTSLFWKDADTLKYYEGITTTDINTQIDPAIGLQFDSGSNLRYKKGKSLLMN